MTRVLPSGGADLSLPLHDANTLELLQDACLVHVDQGALVGLKLHEVDLLRVELQVADLGRFGLLEEDIAKCLFVVGHPSAHI